jgi:7-cyano-7-deazaguanine synthase
MMKTAALVVLSGGQDSTTCLFLAKQQFDVIHAITFDYGQRHRIELDAARKVAELAGVATHEVIQVPNCLRSASPLTSNNALEQYENAEQMEKVIGNRVELTFVPMRNTLFLTIAVNRAVALGVKDIYTGICQEDNANYPDCTEDFRWRFESMANASLDSKADAGILIRAPLMYKTKPQTVRFAQTLPGCWEALAHSHTSYDGKYPPTDMNHANVLRAKGFEDAGLADPLVVRAWHEGLMELPDTENYDALRMFSRRGDGSY